MLDIHFIREHRELLQQTADKEGIAISIQDPAFDFEPRDHVELGEILGILDIARGVKMAGARNYVLKGAGFRVNRAVQQLAMDVLEKRGFTPMDVPMLVRSDALLHTGFFPLGREQTFELAEEDKYLIGTSSVRARASVEPVPSEVRNGVKAE